MSQEQEQEQPHLILCYRKNFGLKILSGPNKNFIPNFLDPKFDWLPYLFGPQIFLDHKFFWTTNFLYPNSFGPQFF